MHNHWAKGLNLWKFIMVNRPEHIVECGFGKGELTEKLIGLRKLYPFKLDVISDGFKEFEFPDWVTRTVGISYYSFMNFLDESIDLCIIDTDHNYWTLAQELNALHPKLKTGGHIALHDVATYYHDTGMALSYGDLMSYPREEIEGIASTYGSLGNALMDFLSTNRFGYKLLEFTSESHGGAIVKKVSLEGVTIFVPGDQPVYAQNR